MEEVKNMEENIFEERLEEVEVQTTFNEDGLDVLCEDATIENKEEEGE